MGTHAVPARGSGASLVDERWFRFLLRAAIALLAFLALWFAARSATGRSSSSARRPSDPDDALWFSWVAATVIE